MKRTILILSFLTATLIAHGQKQLLFSLTSGMSKEVTEHHLKQDDKYFENIGEDLWLTTLDGQDYMIVWPEYNENNKLYCIYMVSGKSISPVKEKQRLLKAFQLNEKAIKERFGNPQVVSPDEFGTNDGSGYLVKEIWGNGDIQVIMAFKDMLHNNKYCVYIQIKDNSFML